MIRDNLEVGIAVERIGQKLQKHFGISEEDAASY